jgi:seryl-tRNA synthetase
MSRLDLAEKRLAQALETLEKAAKAVAGRGPDRSESKAFAEERERLLARVAQLEEELAALGSASQEVEGRLDGAISEIRAALTR